MAINSVLADNFCENNFLVPNHLLSTNKIYPDKSLGLLKFLDHLLSHENRAKESIEKQSNSLPSKNVFSISLKVEWVLSTTALTLTLLITESASCREANHGSCLHNEKREARTQARPFRLRQDGGRLLGTFTKDSRGHEIP